MKAHLRPLLLSALLICFAAIPARAELMYATNGSTIVRFDTLSLGTTTTVAFSGLQVGETIVGFDIRPANGLLYGVGSSNRLYIINPTTGATTQVGTAGMFSLNGTAFGTDFNPLVDRIRQVSNTEQNIRLNPNDGTLTATDTALNPAGNVVAVAYSNNFVGAGSTTLYAIDSASGTLGIITNPNGGGPITTVGSLGLGTNLNENIGFDISGVSGIGFASITTGGISRLYSINLTTGAATLMGAIGSGTTPYLGLTAATAVPEPSTYMLFGAAAGLLAIHRFRARRKIS
jgi:hypothetical protein